MNRSRPAAVRDWLELLPFIVLGLVIAMLWWFACYCDGPGPGAPD